jgi:GntR family transcriptional regulator, transcriptional repressor for pyruvate dehydrogenase complex
VTRPQPVDRRWLDVGVSPQGGTVLEPVRLRSAGEHVADLLVTAIALGEFVPGQRLPSERDLSATLGVSRTTVREAVQRLAALGYVEVRRGRSGGAYVMTSWGPQAREMVSRTLLPGWDRFEGLFDFRQLVEPLIARTAAERRTAKDVERIDAALQAYLAAPDREASRAADQAMHEAVAGATQNPYLANLSSLIRSEISLGFGAEPYSAAIRAKAKKDHARLARAIAAGDAAAAARVGRTHFRLTESTVRELMARINEGETQR